MSWFFFKSHRIVIFHLTLYAFLSLNQIKWVNFLMIRNWKGSLYNIYYILLHSKSFIEIFLVCTFSCLSWIQNLRIGHTRKAHGVNMAFNPASTSALTRSHDRFHKIRILQEKDLKFSKVFNDSCWIKEKT